MKKIILFVVIMSAMALLTAEADTPKAGEQINWQVLSNGGTRSISTNYILQGTICQTAVGEATSTNYRLTHGFWHPLASQSGPCQGRCGDANYDNSINVSDAVYVINYVFNGGGAPRPLTSCGDANPEDGLNISDAFYLILFVFNGGNPPGDCHPNAWEEDCCPY